MAQNPTQIGLNVRQVRSNVSDRFRKTTLIPVTLFQF